MDVIDAGPFYHGASRLPLPPVISPMAEVATARRAEIEVALRRIVADLEEE
jgi:hypothetical protein